MVPLTSVRDASFLGLLTAGRPIGRAVRLLQNTGSGEPRSHGNRSCPPSLPLLRLCQATSQPASQRRCRAAVPAVSGPLPQLSVADGEHSLP